MHTVLASKLGVHVATITKRTERAARMAARKLIRDGHACSAAVYGPAGINPIAYFGSGR